MKKVVLLLSSMLSVCFYVHAKTTTAIASGNWAGAIWDNGAPASADIINIPAGIIVDVYTNTVLKGAGTTTVNIAGTLRMFDLAALRLDGGDGDVVNVLSGGTISNGNAFGGLVTFGNPIFYFPIISISLVGVVSSLEGYLGTSPLAGPISMTSGVLPIELISFDATATTNQVNFNWVTASEFNNSYFTLERFNSADRFDEISVVPGKGTTNELSTYEAIDHVPLAGKNYYRLKQTDFDGSFSYSDVIMVEFSGTLDRLSVYPNPVTSGKVTLDVKHADPDQPVLIQVLNSQGAEIYRELGKPNHLGFLRSTIDTETYATGMYYVRAGKDVKKLVKE